MDRAEGCESVFPTHDASPLSSAAADWLTQNVPGFCGPGRLVKFGFGQSNPTFRLETESADYVLRRKPTGALLPGAHAIDREFRVLQALEKTDVPVPRAYAFCDDQSLIGAPFYVMQLVDGRIFYDQTMPGVGADERAAIFSAMGETVARLHLHTPQALGLENYGRATDFLPRQIDLWTRQYRASEGPHISAMEDLIEWLPRNLPPEQQPRVFHGDLRLDNMIFHATEPRVVALLDWELSTLGDPLADFAYHTMVWRIDARLFRGYADLDRAALGIPEEAEYVRAYCERTGRSGIEHWNFYLAFCLFRVAAILQGVWGRAQSGQASSADARQIGAKAAPLADIGRALAFQG